MDKSIWACIYIAQTVVLTSEELRTADSTIRSFGKMKTTAIRRKEEGGIPHLSWSNLAGKTPLIQFRYYQRLLEHYRKIQNSSGA